MSEKDGKTEKPTQKRLADARKKGQVAKSQDLSSAISFGVFVLLSTLISTFVFQYSFTYLTTSLGNISYVEGFSQNLSQLGVQSMIAFFVLATPFLLIAVTAALIGNIIQTGFHFSWEAIKPDLTKLNPIEGFKNIVGKKATVGFFKNMVKLLLITWLTFNALQMSLPLLFNIGNAGAEQYFFVVVEMMKELGVKLAIFLTLVGVGDFGYQWYDHRKGLSMSQQELKEEYKENEGDPQLKSQRKQRHRDLLNGSISDVKTATAVITNPTHLAVAIRYEKGIDEVPIVVVKGADLMAQKIKEEATLQHIQLIENVPVARALYKMCQPGDPIPADMYEAIAEILALVYQVEAQQKNKI